MEDGWVQDGGVSRESLKCPASCDSPGTWVPAVFNDNQSNTTVTEQKV